MRKIDRLKKMRCEMKMRKGNKIGGTGENQIYIAEGSDEYLWFDTPSLHFRILGTCNQSSQQPRDRRTNSVQLIVFYFVYGLFWWLPCLKLTSAR